VSVTTFSLGRTIERLEKNTTVCVENHELKCIHSNTLLWIACGV